MVGVSCGQARVDGTLSLAQRRVGTGSGAGEGIRTLDHLLGRHIALSGVAPRMARGAKPVQLSSRQPVLSSSIPEPHGRPRAHLGLKGWGRT